MQRKRRNAIYLHARLNKKRLVIKNVSKTTLKFKYSFSSVCRFILPRDFIFDRTLPVWVHAAYGMFKIHFIARAIDAPSSHGQTNFMHAVRSRRQKRSCNKIKLLPHHRSWLTFRNYAARTPRNRNKTTEFINACRYYTSRLEIAQKNLCRTSFSTV